MCAGGTPPYWLSTIATAATVFFSATLVLSRSDLVSSRFPCLKKSHLLPDVCIMVCRHYLLNMYLKNATDVCLQCE